MVQTTATVHVGVYLREPSVSSAIDLYRNNSKAFSALGLMTNAQSATMGK
jgi:hypothetical protein